MAVQLNMTRAGWEEKCGIDKKAEQNRGGTSQEAQGNKEGQKDKRKKIQQSGSLKHGTCTHAEHGKNGMEMEDGGGG